MARAGACGPAKRVTPQRVSSAGNGSQSSICSNTSVPIALLKRTVEKRQLRSGNRRIRRLFGLRSHAESFAYRFGTSKPSHCRRGPMSFPGIYYQNVNTRTRAQTHKEHVTRTIVSMIRCYRSQDDLETPIPCSRWEYRPTLTLRRMTNAGVTLP